MLQENRDLAGKRNNAKMVIGYDLGRQFSHSGIAGALAIQIVSLKHSAVMAQDL